MGEGKPAFRKAALALNGGPTDELVVTFGCQLAKPTAAELVAIHVIEVDWSHELSDELTQENEAASAVLDKAEGIAEHFKVKLSADLLQAREVAAALVDEAIEVGADAIILGLPYRKRFGGDFAIGATIPYVFQNAPCQVLVVREPMPNATRVEAVPVAEKIAVPTASAPVATAGSGSTGGLGWSFRRSRGNGRKNQGAGG
jgi:nucleotide-binding universal stress UspA family protein